MCLYLYFSIRSVPVPVQVQPKLCVMKLSVFVNKTDRTSIFPSPCFLRSLTYKYSTIFRRSYPHYVQSLLIIPSIFFFIHLREHRHFFYSRNSLYKVQVNYLPRAFSYNVRIFISLCFLFHVVKHVKNSATSYFTVPLLSVHLFSETKYQSLLFFGTTVSKNSHTLAHRDIC